MRVTRTSPLTGRDTTMDLPVTKVQLDELSLPRRRLIQDIFPDLTSDQREFILSGYTPEDWAKMFPPGGAD